MMLNGYALKCSELRETAMRHLAGFTPFGQKYVIEAELAFHKRTAIVRTVWIIENGTEFPRLVSCYVK